MSTLFQPLTRDARQALSFKRWLDNKGRGTIVAATGYGKTRVGTNTIQKLVNKTPGLTVLIVVPTDTLKEQWTTILDNLGLLFNCQVQVINTVVKHTYQVDLLLLDEAHRYNSDIFQQVFLKVKYKLVLGLTATFERLDGKHEIMQKYCPIVDEVNIGDALANGWVSQYTEYKVYLEVDLSEYNKLNKEFIEHFGFFNYDFNLAMKMTGPKGYLARIQYRDFLCKSDNPDDKAKVLKNIMYHAMGLMHTLQARKKFINSHPKKLEIARQIINARKNKKIITFSNSIKIAEDLMKSSSNKLLEYTYSGKDSKKKSKITVEDFNAANVGVLHTVQKANEGLDVRGLSVGIILGLDSSATKATQRRGRVIRKEENKTAEVFNLIIRGTVEEKWFETAHKGDPIITIDEDNLQKVLNYETFEEYKRKPTQFSYRF